MIYLYSPNLPPSSNNAYYNIPGKGKARALTTEGKKYKAETTTFLSRNFPWELKFILPDVPYFVYARFSFLTLVNDETRKGTKTRYKKFDVSNRLKLFEDCLKDVCGIDDSQFLLETIEKRVGTEENTETFIWNMEKEKLPIGELLRL